MILLAALGDDFSLTAQNWTSSGISVTVEYILTDWIPDTLVDENGLELMIPDSGIGSGLSALGDDLTLNAE